jgi:hypothetical protein
MPDAQSASSPLATPSKVTINVRDLAHAASPLLPNAEPSEPTGTSGDGSLTADHQPSTAHLSSVQLRLRDTSTEPEASSSTADSPEIEAAEPEDVASPIPASVWVQTPGRDEAVELNTMWMQALPFLEPEECPESYLERLSWLVDHGISLCITLPS